ncbi:MAG TPA: dienelactone hydrolase family protein [Propionibacteriaceae bacterium]
MKLRELRVRVPAADGEIEAIIIEPVGRRPTQGVLYYTDIFQLTESTLRTARRLASAGLLVCLPEIYPRDLPGMALEFDDAGKQAGLGAAARTTTAQFDSDCAALLDHLQQRDDIDQIDVVGFCLGGHLAFRAAFDPRVTSTVCFYPTGLHNGSLGSDQADSLKRAADIGGRLMIIFGTEDPHVPADARLQIITRLYEAGLQHVELHLYSGGEHAFMRDIGPRHDPVLTDLSLTEAIAFLTGR